jgi:hypothetical protein
LELLTAEIEACLRANGRRQEMVRGTDDEIDFQPVVKLFTPDGACTWLLTEIDANDPDLAFGLCDLGIGFPELGYVSLAEICALRGKLGLPVERDIYFIADKTLSAYTEQACRLGHIEA